jgi:hypothetical protein
MFVANPADLFELMFLSGYPTPEAVVGGKLISPPFSSSSFSITVRVRRCFSIT